MRGRGWPHPAWRVAEARGSGWTPVSAPLTHPAPHSSQHAGSSSLMQSPHWWVTQHTHLYKYGTPDNTKQHEACQQTPITHCSVPHHQQSLGTHIAEIKEKDQFMGRCTLVWTHLLSLFCQKVRKTCSLVLSRDTLAHITMYYGSIHSNPYNSLLSSSLLGCQYMCGLVLGHLVLVGTVAALIGMDAVMWNKSLVDVPRLLLVLSSWNTSFRFLNKFLHLFSWHTSSSAGDLRQHVPYFLVC